MTHRTTDVSPYRIIETASNKPRLEATGPEFASPGTRILTFLPWVGASLQKVNTESKFVLAYHLLRLL
jgi:hypothetical protein